jgi:hypothetical protein
MRRVHIRSKYNTQSFGGWGGLLGGKVGSKFGSRLGKLFGKKFGKKMANKYLPGLFWKLGGALLPGLPLFSMKKK